ncbi:hypothetical protein YC2023_022502 [Brassica napus]
MARTFHFHPLPLGMILHACPSSFWHSHKTRRGKAEAEVSTKGVRVWERIWGRVSRISIERFSFGDDAEKEIKGECVCHHGGDTIHEVYSVFSRRYGAMSASLNQLCTSRNVLANTIVGSADIIYMDIAI